MKYSVTMGWDGSGLAEYRGRLQAAEAAGWDRLGVGDSPPVFRELNVALSVAAYETRRIALASMVATPLGRNPMVVANAICSLQDLSEGRFTLALGAGGSAPSAMGVQPSTLAEVEDYVRALRALLAGEHVTWGGADLTPPRDPRPTPIHIATYGPKARRQAGAIGDGVIIASGPRNPLLPAWVEDVRRGARDAGRDPDAVEIWVMSRFALSDDPDAALAEIKGSLASAGRFGFRSAAELDAVPAKVRDALLQFRDAYDVSNHTTWDGGNAKLVDRLGLTDFLAERFAIVGDLDACRRQLRQFPTDLNITGVQISSIVKNPRGVIDILPALRAD